MKYKSQIRKPKMLSSVRMRSSPPQRSVGNTLSLPNIDDGSEAKTAVDDAMKNNAINVNFIYFISKIMLLHFLKR
jgi:hypothetical protein